MSDRSAAPEMRIAPVAQAPLREAEPPRADASRRSLLASGLGAIAGLVASALGRPAVARAADNDHVVLGSDSNQSTNTTKITVPTANFGAVWVVASGSGGLGLRATASASNGMGILGESAGTGVRGTSSGSHTGVEGISASGIGVAGDGGTYIGVYGTGDQVGTWGQSNSGWGIFGESNSGTAVLGQTINSGGPGVLGRSSGYGTGVFGFSSGSGGIVPASQANTGVYGRADQAGSTGVWGDSNAADGTGVQGHSRVGIFGTSTTAGWMGIWGRHFGAGYGVAGDSISLIGVSGTSNATDHPATVGKSQGNSTGVLGFSGAEGDALPAARGNTGVFGQATLDAGSRGVLGVSAVGDGVRGEVTSGAAVHGVASAKSGYGVRTSGRVRFDKVSGVATIPANATTVVVTPGTDVTSESFVLLTAKTNIVSRSLSFSTDTSGDRFTIRMSSSRSTSTSVAWLLLN